MSFASNGHITNAAALLPHKSMIMSILSDLTKRLSESTPSWSASWSWLLGLLSSLFVASELNKKFFRPSVTCLYQELQEKSEGSRASFLI